jgi:hypothetical protein
LTHVGPSTSRGAGTLVRCGRSCTYVRRDRRPAAAAAAAEHPTRRRRPCVRVRLCLACSVDHRPRHSTRVPTPTPTPTCGDGSLAGFALLLRGEKRVANGARGGRGIGGERAKIIRRRHAEKTHGRRERGGHRRSHRLAYPLWVLDIRSPNGIMLGIFRGAALWLWTLAWHM